MSDLSDGMVDAVWEDEDVRPHGLEQVFTRVEAAPILNQEDERLKGFLPQVNQLLTPTETLPVSAQNKLVKLEK